MSIPSSVSTHHQKWHKAEDQLNALKNLQDIDSHTQFHNKFRLLPRTPMYLMSSHYFGKDSFSWSLKKKWDLFTIFDKALKNFENLPKAKEALKAAIVDQTNILLLRELHAV